MKTVLKTAPAAEPVLKAAAKIHLNIEAAFTGDDNYIDTLIPMARENAEQITQRRLITQTWYLYLDDWPDSGELILPFGSLQSVTSVKYTDTADDQSTMSNTEYTVDINSRIGRIVLDYGESWPTDTLHPTNPIVVEFICGYGVAGANVPDPIIQAIMVDIADMFWSRSSDVPERNIPVIEHLLRRYRLWL